MKYIALSRSGMDDGSELQIKHLSSSRKINFVVMLVTVAVKMTKNEATQLLAAKLGGIEKATSTFLAGKPSQYEW